jgi:bacteriocin-like protein
MKKIYLKWGSETLSENEMKNVVGGVVVCMCDADCALGTMCINGVCGNGTADNPYQLPEVEVTGSAPCPLPLGWSTSAEWFGLLCHL